MCHEVGAKGSGQMVTGTGVLRGRLHDGVGKFWLPTLDEDEPMMPDASVWFGSHTRSVLVACCCVRFIAQVADFSRNVHFIFGSSRS
jgi:hypothetical protein